MIASIFGAGHESPVATFSQSAEIDLLAETEFVTILATLSLAPAARSPTEDTGRSVHGTLDPTETDAQGAERGPLTEAEDDPILLVRDQFLSTQQAALTSQNPIVCCATENGLQSTDRDPPPEAQNVTTPAERHTSSLPLVSVTDGDHPKGGRPGSFPVTFSPSDQYKTAHGPVPDDSGAMTHTATLAEVASTLTSASPNAAPRPMVDPGFSLPIARDQVPVRLEGAPSMKPVAVSATYKFDLFEFREQALQTASRDPVQASLEERRAAVVANAFTNTPQATDVSKSGSIQAENGPGAAPSDHRKPPLTSQRLVPDLRLVSQPQAPVVPHIQGVLSDAISVVGAVQTSGPSIPPPPIQTAAVSQGGGQASPTDDKTAERSAHSSASPTLQSVVDDAFGHPFLRLDQAARPDVAPAAMTAEDILGTDPPSPSGASLPLSFGGQVASLGGGSPQGTPVPAPFPQQLSAELSALAIAGPDGPVTLHLRPEELGLLHFQLTRTAEGTHIHLTVEQPATLDLLRRHADDLLADLQRAGFGGTSLSYSGSDGRSAAQNQSGPGVDESTDTPSQPAFPATPLRLPAVGSLDLRL